MSPFSEALVAKYGWIWIGLTFGFAAKYALLIKRGVQIKASLVIADLLLLPMVALIAYWMVSRAGVDAEGAALITAGATVGADRLVKFYTYRFVRGVTDVMQDEATRRRQILREEVQTEISADRIVNDIATGKRSLDQ